MCFCHHSYMGPFSLPNPADLVFHFQINLSAAQTHIYYSIEQTLSKAPIVYHIKDDLLGLGFKEFWYRDQGFVPTSHQSTALCSGRGGGSDCFLELALFFSASELSLLPLALSIFPIYIYYSRFKFYLLQEANHNIHHQM